MTGYPLSFETSDRVQRLGMIQKKSGITSRNASLKRGGGDFSRPLDGEAEASPTQRPPDK
jgi:hypothetical protein